MINLLPTDLKQNISYARQNTTLFRWSVGLILTTVGLVAVLAAGLLYIRQSISSYSSQIQTQNEQLQIQNIDQTQKKIEEISSSTKLALQVLSKTVLFSELIQQIGNVMPANTSLNDLKINKLEGGIDIISGAADYSSATQVQVNLQDPENKIFDKADIISINCTGAASADPRYPCTVTVRAQFAKDNPFLFISDGGGA